MIKKATIIVHVMSFLFGCTIIVVTGTKSQDTSRANKTSRVVQVTEAKKEVKIIPKLVILSKADSLEKVMDSIGITKGKEKTILKNTNETLNQNLENLEDTEGNLHKRNKRDSIEENRREEKFVVNQVVLIDTTASVDYVVIPYRDTVIVEREGFFKRMFNFFPFKKRKE